MNCKGAVALFAHGLRRFARAEEREGFCRVLSEGTFPRRIFRRVAFFTALRFAPDTTSRISSLNRLMNIIAFMSASTGP
jgi:hypothetical protein